MWALKEGAPPRNGTHSSPELLAAFATCSETTHKYEFSAYDDISKFGAHTPCRGAYSTSCELAEDRTGKPGYILRKAENQTAEVRFLVDFGARPVIAVTYLRTYNRSDYGDAMMWISSPGASRGYRLGGIHDQLTSISVTEYIAAGSRADQSSLGSPESAAMGLGSLGSAGAFGFAVPPQTRGATIHVHLVAGKRFKLIALSAC